MSRSFVRHSTALSYLARVLGEDVDRYFGRSSAWRQVTSRRSLCSACTDGTTLFKIFAVLCAAPLMARGGKTSSSAFQKPSAPSPTAISRAIFSPRLFASTSSSASGSRSAAPTWKPMSSFLPSGVGADQHQHAFAMVGCGEPAGGRPATRTRTGAPTDRASASARTRPATPPSVWRSLPEKDWRRILAQECRQRLLEVAPVEMPADRAPAKVRPSPSCAVPTAARFAEVKRLAHVAGRTAIPDLHPTTSTARSQSGSSAPGHDRAARGGRPSEAQAIHRGKRLPSRQPAQAAAGHQIARYSSVDHRSHRADAVGQCCYSGTFAASALSSEFWRRLDAAPNAALSCSFITRFPA